MALQPHVAYARLPFRLLLFRVLSIALRRFHVMMASLAAGAGRFRLNSWCRGFRRERLSDSGARKEDGRCYHYFSCLFDCSVTGTWLLLVC